MPSVYLYILQWLYSMYIVHILSKKNLLGFKHLKDGQLAKIKIFSPRKNGITYFYKKKIAILFSGQSVQATRSHPVQYISLAESLTYRIVRIHEHIYVNMCISTVHIV